VLANGRCRRDAGEVLPDDEHGRDPAERPDDMPVCGPRCLREALRRFAIEAGSPDVTQRCKTSCEGTSIRNLLAAARSYELRAYVCKVGTELLLDLVCSGDSIIIAHTRKGHFVLVECVTEESVTLWDPDQGTCELSRLDFEEAWDGVCIVLRSPPTGSAQAGL